MYGLGSFVKKAVKKVTKPFTKVAKKIVPREVAGIMRAAAPFLPPGYREAAYLLGTAKQTGRISPMDLALTAAPTFFSKTDLGRGIAQSVGDFKLPGMERNLRDVTLGTPAFSGTTETIQRSPMGGTMTLEGVGARDATSGILGKGGKFFQFGVKDSPKILDTKAGQFLLGGEDGKFSKAKVAGVGVGVLSLIQNANTPREAGIALAQSTGNSDDYERGYQLFSQLKPELFNVPDEFRMDAKNGGRIGFNQGTGRRGLGSMDPDIVANSKAGLGTLEEMKGREFNVQEFMINKYNEDGTKPNIIGEGFQGDDRIFIIETPNFGTMTITIDQYLENFGIPERKITKANGGLMRTNYAMGSGDDDDKPVLPEDPTKPVNPFAPKPIKPLGDMKMAEFDMKDYMEEFERVFPEMKNKRGTQEYMDMLEDYFRGLAAKEAKGIMMAKEGGRANLALGTKPTPEESGLGGLPIEADMRYTGGFMPYGAKEKADDVPARLSKNEFVFTADAVRAAGGGSVNEGAKKMYQAMKQLEAKPEAKGMMA